MESGIWSENHSAVAQESLGTSKGKETKVSKQIIYDLGLKPVERQPSKHSEKESWDDDFIFQQSSSSTSSLALPVSLSTPSKRSSTVSMTSLQKTRNSSRPISQSSFNFKTPKKSQNYSVAMPGSNTGSNIDKGQSESVSSSEVEENWDEPNLTSSIKATPSRGKSSSQSETTPIASRISPVMTENMNESGNQRRSFDFTQGQEALFEESAVEKRTRKRSSWKQVLGLGKSNAEKYSRTNNISSSRSASTTSLSLESNKTSGFLTTQSNSTRSTIPIDLESLKDPSSTDFTTSSEFSGWSEVETFKGNKKGKKRTESINGTIKNKKELTGPTSGIYANSRRPSIPLPPNLNFTPPLPRQRNKSTKTDSEQETRASKLLRRISGTKRSISSSNQVHSSTQSPSASSSRPPSAAGRNSFYNLIPRSTSAIQISKRPLSPATDDSIFSQSRPASRVSSIATPPPVPSFPRSLSGRFHRPSNSIDSVHQPNLLTRVRTFSKSSNAVEKEKMKNWSMPNTSKVNTPTKKIESKLEVIPGSVSSKYLLELQNSPTISRAGHSATIMSNRPDHRPSASFSDTLAKPRDRNSYSHSRRVVSEVYLMDENGFELGKSNSLSNLRIPERIIAGQEKIGKDLENVKEFARGVVELKGLREQYQQLSPSKSIILGYKKYWEQADALISLGDGPSSPETVLMPSPSKNRATSASGIIEAEVEERKREMLRDVLLKKGQSLPNRKEASPRPSILSSPSKSSFTSGSPTKSIKMSISRTLPILPLSFHSPTPAQSCSDLNGIDKPKQKVGGIKEFLRKLRLKGFESNSNRLHEPSSQIIERRSFSDPTYNSINRKGLKKESERNDDFNLKFSDNRERDDDEEEDWDLTLTTEIAQLSLDSDLVENGEVLMELSTEGMPRLLLKIDEVKEYCMECLEQMEAA